MSNEHELRRDKRNQSVVQEYQRRRLRYKQLGPSTVLGTVQSCFYLKQLECPFFNWVIFRVHITWLKGGCNGAFGNLSASCYGTVELLYRISTLMSSTLSESKYKSFTMENCCESLVKYFMVFFNILFILAGCILIGFGAWIQLGAEVIFFNEKLLT